MTLLIGYNNIFDVDAIYYHINLCCYRDYENIPNIIHRRYV